MNNYAYSCPSCGGKLNYDSKANRWECEYCRKTYNFTFAYAKDNIKTNESNFYYSFLFCEYCNKKIITSDKKNCPYCGANLKEIEKVEAYGKANKTLSNDDARTTYNLLIKYYLDDEKRSEFLNAKFEDKYIYCNQYYGTVCLKSGNIQEKYFFLNVLIPCINLDNYMIAYEICNIGCNKELNLLSSPLSNLKRSDVVIDEVIKDNEAASKDDIINSCIDSFIKRNGIKNKASIIVSDNLLKKNGVLLPFYVASLKCNNKRYDEYIFRYLVTIRNACVLSLPCKDINLKKCKILFYSFVSIAVILGAMLTVILFILLFVHQLNNILYSYDVYLVVLLLFLIFFVVLAFLYNKKIKYYKHSINVSKNDYLSQLVDNSSYVKRVRSKG